jgi:hypothetical protein
MTNAAYQAMLTEIDNTIGKEVGQLSVAQTPTAVNRATTAITTAADKAHTDLLAAVPPKAVQSAHETFTTAIAGLSNSASLLGMSAESGQVCASSSAMPRFTNSPAAQALREAFQTLASADPLNPITVGAWLPAPGQEQTRQPGNGTFVKTGGRSGSGHLEIDNRGSKSDAVVGLVGQGTTNVVFSVYVRAGAKYTVTGVRNGTYGIYVTMGVDWDPDAGGFSRNCNYNKFDESITYAATATRYQIWQITLEFVSGNGGTGTVNPEEFPH